MRAHARPRHVAPLAAALLIVVTVSAPPGRAEDARQRQILDEILALSADAPEGRNPNLPDFADTKWVQGDRRKGPITPKDRTWADWLKRTGELPPDFDALPSIPFLPDLLVFDEGGRNIPVTTPAQWQEKRRWIGEQVQRWVCGAFPPPPDNLAAEVVEERVEGGVAIQRVVLRFGPDRKAALTLRLFIPPGDGRRPVFMTQRSETWIHAALKRGYLGCLCAGGAGGDETEAYGALYPDHDFAHLMRRAWGASRAIDYLVTRPEVAPDQIAMVGHSRSGFQALMAAAFDERIRAVVPASATVGLNGFRTTDRHNTQTMDEISYAFPYWFSPRLRFFVGREHKLPVDQNAMMALVAPRAMLLTAAVREADGNPWAVERMYTSVKRVYDLLGAKDRLALRHRGGEHGVPDAEFEVNLDFFDTVFGRARSFSFEEKKLFPYAFDRWAARSGERIDPNDWPAARPEDGPLAGAAGAVATPEGWPKRRAEIQSKIRWLLGDLPPDPPATLPAAVEAGPVPDEAKLNSQALKIMPFDAPRLPREALRIGPVNAAGETLRAWLFRPAAPAGGSAGRKPPAVVFLHGFAYSTGFIVRHGPIIERFVAQGAAVAAIDAVGFHGRLEEGTDYYERTPRGSMLGRMVYDVRCLVAGLQGVDGIDASRVAVVGDGLGGAVALVAAALDDRIAGVAACNAFTPLRSSSREIEGLRAYSHEYGLLPRLGFFVGHEDRVPVDFDGILACVAPRPLLVIASRLDRHAESDRVAECVRKVEPVYRLLGAPDRLRLEKPRNYHRFTAMEKEMMVKWVRDVTK